MSAWFSAASRSTFRAPATCSITHIRQRRTANSPTYVESRKVLGATLGTKTHRESQRNTSTTGEMPHLEGFEGGGCVGTAAAADFLTEAFLGLVPDVGAF